MKKYHLIATLGLIVAFKVIAGFDLAAQEVKKNIESDKAKKVKTEITFPAGKLYISSNANSFCEGIYKYHRDYWKPDISYYEESETGYLDINVDDNRNDKHYDDSEENEWIIAFKRDVRNDIKISMIAGESDIDLQGCRLEGFEFDMIAGQTKINLKNTSVPFLEFKAIAGEAEIDLTGDWKNDLDAEIRGGVGEMTIKLPSEVGVKVNISGGLGDIHAPGFNKHNKVYTNDLYGKTKTSLYIDITGGIGNVSIRMPD
ncbi:MAG: toast rack family protein [Bacteroidia bacterium]|nr:toast rack family protein [Bacteroidia bacterium]